MPGDESPHSTYKAAEEEALGRQCLWWEQAVEEADAGPGCANGAGDEDCHSQYSGREFVDESYWILDSGFDAEESEGAVDEGEEADVSGKGGAEVVEEVSGAGGFAGVEEGAGGVF